ncbi:MAG: PAS domain S-box protein, partial [Bryobacteraceae bacterium]
GPAWVAAILGGVSVSCFFYAPLWSPGLESVPGYVEFGLYTVVSAGIAFLGGAMQAAPSGAHKKLHQTREDLALSDERLSLTLGSAGIGVWSRDLENNLIEGDENYRNLFGLPRGHFDFTVDMFVEMLHPEDRERVIREINAAVEETGEYSSEFRVTWPTGEVRYLSSRGNVYFDSSGRASRRMGVCWDVTEQRRVEENLRAATQRLAIERKFRELLEAAPDAVVVANEDGRIILVNTESEKLFGYSRDELLGQTIELLVPRSFRGKHPAQRAGFAAEHRSRIKGAGLNLHALRKDGTEFPVEISLSMLDTEDGPLVYSAIRDITERARAEAKFRSLLEAAPDAVVVADQQGKIVLVNTQAGRLFGYLRDELLGQTIDMLVPERLRGQHPGHRTGFFAEPRVRNMRAGTEIFAVRKDGTEVPVEINLSPVDTDEGVLVSAAIRDITVRKRVESQIMNLNQQLKEAAKDAKAANLAKSTFLSTMSHEIRTPMNAILGYAQLMTRDPGLGAEARSNLEVIGRSGEHLMTLLDGVLNMSKIEAGRIELHPVAFNLPNLLTDLEGMYRSKAEAKGLRFEMLVDGESVPYVRADEPKLRQMLMNLLGNAVKFTRTGQITLHIALNQRNDGRLWLSAIVKDTGAGIAAEDHEKVFELFSQTKSTPNTQEGTGLGLAISRRYARLMGGDVTVSSTPGKGSCFQFDIPIERGDARFAIRRSAPRRVKRIRPGEEVPGILVVDDQFENRDWLLKLLANIGFPVQAAGDGEAAIEIWTVWNPGLILMDVHMPLMDGLEAMRRIKSHPRGKATVIVALTASAMEEDRQNSLQSGADDFLAKPCREDEMLEKIGTLLNIPYEYDATTQTVESSSASTGTGSLGELPMELLEELLGATTDGNKRLLDRLIQRVQEIGGKGCADELRHYADQYEYDALTRRLEEARTAGPAPRAEAPAPAEGPK